MPDNSEFHILIVDDTKVNIVILSEILTNVNYNVEFATNGDDALQMLTNKFDIILLDVMMPDMDGFEVCEQIKLNSETSDIPIIFITAVNEVDNVIKGIKAGAVDFITKPFNTDELLARINTHIQLKFTRKQLQAKNNQLNTVNTSLIDSINYAYRIQQAALPKQEFLKEILPYHFIFFAPRNIVSGDFYWMRQINQKVVVIVGDCTGHGVPGAFLSMLGISILNEITGNFEQISAAKIHDKLHQKLNKALKQGNSISEMKDTIELAICILDYENNDLQFAGSGSVNFFLISKDPEKIKTVISDYKAYNYNDKEIINIRSAPSYLYNRVNSKQTTINQYNIQLSEGDLIYLTSDGYMDQIGGGKMRKFLKNRFAHLLLEISDKSMDEQKNVIESEFIKWKGDCIQLDDVTVLGFKIQHTYGDVDLF